MSFGGLFCILFKLCLVLMVFGVGAVFSFWWGVGVFDTVACFGWGCCVFCFLLEGGVWCTLLRCFLSCLGFVCWFMLVLVDCCGLMDG